MEKVTPRYLCKQRRIFFTKNEWLIPYVLIFDMVIPLTVYSFLYKNHDIIEKKFGDTRYGQFEIFMESVNPTLL